MTTWLVVLAVGAAKLRVPRRPDVLGGRWLRSPAVERTVSTAGTAALAALVGGSAVARRT